MKRIQGDGSSSTPKRKRAFGLATPARRAGVEQLKSARRWPATQGGYMERVVPPKRKLTYPTLAEHVESALKAEIIEGFLVPGERLRVSDLAERFGVSPTPLREALQRLAAENLIELDPRYGATVSGISIDDLRDTYWMIEILEGIALERSITRADADWETRARHAWSAFSKLLEGPTGQSHEEAVALSSAHWDFHSALFAACDSPWLLRYISNLVDHAERYRMLSARIVERDHEAEHHNILQLALARDTSGAVDAHRRHLARTVEILESSLVGASRDRIEEPVATTAESA